MVHLKCMHVTLAVFTAIVVMAVCGVVIAGIITGSNQNSLQRYCITANSDLLNTPSTGNMIGALSTTISDTTIS